MFFSLKPRVLALAMLAVALLGACASPTPQPVPSPAIEPTAGTTTPGGAATSVPTLQPSPAATVQATAVPMALPTALPVLPTALPTAQPTSPAAPQPLLGPEWVVLGQGDLYGTGVETVVAYRPSSFGITRAQLPPQYVGYGVVLDQLVIVERNALGQPYVRVLVTPGGVVLDGDNANPRFPPGGPNGRTFGFALAMEHQSAPPRLVPVDQQGVAVEWGFSVRYDAGVRGFALELLTPPSDPVRAAVVSGRVAYPAGGAPPLEVYAVNVDDPSRFYMTSTSLNNTLFSMRLPAGRYQLFAYTMPGSEPVLSGAYTEYVRCGERIECSDHTVLTLTVGADETWDGIVIGDWFNSTVVFPGRPQGQPQPQP